MLTPRQLANLNPYTNCPNCGALVGRTECNHTSHIRTSWGGSTLYGVCRECVDIPCNPDGLAMDCCATCQFVKLRRFDRRQCYCDQTDMDVAETSVCNEYERHAELEWD